MSAPLDELFDPDFPHATPEGWRRGCRGNFCSGMQIVGWTCAEAWVRFQGDWSYRRRVTEGWTPEAIREADRAEAAAVAEREKREQQERARAAKAAEVGEVATTREKKAPVALTPKPRVKAVKPPRRVLTWHRRWSPDEDATVRFLNSLMKDDRQIAAIVGRDRETVRRRRRELGLPARGKAGRPRKAAG